MSKYGNQRLFINYTPIRIDLTWEDMSKVGHLWIRSLAGIKNPTEPRSSKYLKPGEQPEHVDYYSMASSVAVQKYLGGGILEDFKKRRTEDGSDPGDGVAANGLRFDIKSAGNLDKLWGRVRSHAQNHHLYKGMIYILCGLQPNIYEDSLPYVEIWGFIFGVDLFIPKFLDTEDRGTRREKFVFREWDLEDPRKLLLPETRKCQEDYYKMHGVSEVLPEGAIWDSTLHDEAYALAQAQIKKKRKRRG
jgi:hypothetical protein